MSTLSAISQPITPIDLKPPPDLSTALHGRALLIGRALVAIIFAATWLCFWHAVTFWPGHPRDGMGNFNPDMAGHYSTILDWLLMGVSTLAAGLILWRKSSDKMGLFSAVTILTFAAANTSAIMIMEMYSGNWQMLAACVMAMGYGFLLIFLYVFPDGRFVPSWTKYVSIAWVAWVVTWPFVPQLSAIADQLPRGLVFGILTPLYLSGVSAQAYRRRNTSAVELQQTKWTLFGLSVAVLGFFMTSFFNYIAVPMMLHDNGNTTPVLFLIMPLISTLTILAVPLTISMSLLRFRLWELDPLIHRTVIYGVATIGLGVVFFLEIVIFQAIFIAIIGQKSDVAIVGSTLIIAMLFRPVRHHAKDMIDRRFYREKVDFEKTFTELSREIRTIIEVPQLSDILLKRVSDLLHISYSAVVLKQPDGAFKVEAKSNIDELCKFEQMPALANMQATGEFTLKSEWLNKLTAGHTLVMPKDLPFSLIVPLIGPRAGTTELIGMLAYGPRRSGQDYSREDQNLLRNLADQAGTAMYVAHLIEQQREETQRREHAEHALEAHRHSPLGKAETLAVVLSAQPETALTELHTLTQRASDDPATGALLNNLYRVLDEPTAAPISQLAGGYLFMYKGLSDPELLPLGLRTLIKQLGEPPTSSWAGAYEALILYRLGQDALAAHTPAQITELLPGFQAGIESCMAVQAVSKISKISNAAHPLSDNVENVPPFLIDLRNSMIDLRGVAETLHAYERVDTAQDKLAYLVSAVERLSRVDRSARTDLGSADRGLILQIAEKWLAIVSGIMSEIQTRAQITCRLLTHHTWQDDVISLSLNVRNDGRSAALKIRVNLAPSPDYTLIDPAVVIERLAPDEETQVELRIRPRLAPDVDQFRARFIVQYADPRGSDQVENFADVVYLLKTTGDFKFIPNPYVVGTPLQTGSPLFIGREDVVAFIQENLAAAHRNNLVLIGQRRTGKTSLLKQLPAQLGEDYLPVYLDGQSLSLDPGMANFFLNFATQISYAIEDRGLVAPEMPDFTDSPAATFERVFLTRARQIIGDRHLLILFDEFEELETSVRHGNIDPSVFGFLRHLIQHGEKISVIFCGTHRMEELASDYWNVLFNISLYRHVGFLEQTEAQRLIQDPVAEYGMRYDDLALDKMWRITAGHPYFLQLLCHSLVNRHNRTKRSYMTVADVNAALDEILASGEAHFVYLWTEATPQERLVLAALSRSMLLTGRSTLVQVQDYLDERGIHLHRSEISGALNRLVLTDVLSSNKDNEATADEMYRWRLGLIGLWVEKYKSMSRVADELNPRERSVVIDR